MREMIVALATTLISALSMIPLSSFAKINNSIEQNKAQYGTEIEIDNFSGDEINFTGYRTYSVDSNWKLTAFFKNGKVRTEHLVPKTQDKSTVLDRVQVKLWADKMFAVPDRGVYHKQVNEIGAEGHFFDTGLVAYEYFVENNAHKGFKGVKVLLFEGAQKFWQINPKAYL